MGSRRYSLSEPVEPLTDEMAVIAANCCPLTNVSGMKVTVQFGSLSIFSRLSAMLTGRRLANWADCCTPVAFIAPYFAGQNGTESLLA